MATRSRSTSRARSLLRPLPILGLMVLVVVALALLALPFLQAPGHAASARTDLESAKAALTSGDVDTAEASVASARRNTDQLQEAMQGVGGDIWSWVPVVGRPVSDVRHLGNALDELTSVAELGVATLPQVNGQQATLFSNGAVDLVTLQRLTDDVDTISQRLTAAESELTEVADKRLVGGSRLGEVRDEALGLVGPLGDGVETISPVLDVLPGLLGSEDQRKFLIAMLNPSELRYSGGAVLALSELTTQDGRFEVSDAFDSEESPALFRPFYWKKVRGNPFHRGRQSVQTATYAPTWPVAGNELLNAFRSLRGRPGAGLIAVDAVALGRLLQFTGPITVAGYPPLTSDNFAFETVGNYDAHPDPAERRGLNKALAPSFTKALLSPRDVVAKLTMLHDLAQARHFAVYLRTPEAQEAFTGLGLGGDFPETDRDFIGVFSQNTNVSKADYWQRRSVSSDVRVHSDGSAEVRLRLSVHNDSPPALPGAYEQKGQSYTTRWNGMSLAAFLPTGAEVTDALLDGRTVPFTRRQYFGRPFVRRTIDFPPQSRKTYEIRYHVPSAAVVEHDGLLTYRLDLTPQGMVIPQAVKVRVRFPQGYEVGSLADGWRSNGVRTAIYETPGLETSETFEITANP